MENSMQQVEQKKSEKLVPIDTSGKGVDVELKEESSSTVTSVNENDPNAEKKQQLNMQEKFKDSQKFFNHS